MNVESPDVYARRTIAHALRTRPHDVWTIDALAHRFGIARTLVSDVLSDLVRIGAVEQIDGPDEEYASAGMGGS